MPVEAQDHLRDCPVCQRLEGALGELDESVPRAGLEDRVIATLSRDLKPVRSLAPGWCYAGLLLSVAGLITATGAGLLGAAGWRSNSGLQRVAIGGTLLAGLIASALMVVRRMVPGALPRMRAAMLPVATIAVLIAAGAFLYPLRHYEFFGRAVVACFSIGLGFALPAGAVVACILRRGFVVSLRETAALAGLFSGLTGMAVLLIFCPHLDSGHYLLGHASMVVASTLLGLAAATLGNSRQAR
jgi:predicted anti-sigma-YlaC factor YlaD